MFKKDDKCFFRCKPYSKISILPRIVKTKKDIIKVDNYCESKKSGVRITGNSRGLIVFAQYLLRFAFNTDKTKDRILLSPSNKKLDLRSLSVILSKTHFENEKTVKLKVKKQFVSINMAALKSGHFPYIKKPFNAFIRIRKNKHGCVSIKGNYGGYIYLAKHLIAMACLNSPEEFMHIHLLYLPNNNGNLNKGSIEVTIDNTDFYPCNLKKTVNGLDTHNSLFVH